MSDKTFECEYCGNQYEKRTLPCPTCGARRMKRVATLLDAFTNFAVYQGNTNSYSSAVVIASANWDELS